jgi:hypothetical protein
VSNEPASKPIAEQLANQMLIFRYKKLQKMPLNEMALSTKADYKVAKAAPFRDCGRVGCGFAVPLVVFSLMEKLYE